MGLWRYSWIILVLVLASPVQAQTPPLDRIVAESIGLDVPVVSMGWETTTRNGERVNTWVIPEDAAGWHQDSKMPGEGGNVVISGNNNTGAEVFRDIGELVVGDIITLHQGDTTHQYAVAHKLFLEDVGQPPAVRQANARWIGPIAEERLTLVSNWPYTNATAKVIIIAHPIDAEAGVLPSLADNPLTVPAPISSQLAPIPDTPRPALISRIVAPAIGLNSEIVEVGWKPVNREGQTVNVWEVADHAAGWHVDSSLPGEGGNVVLSGHHNVRGKVFRHLIDLTPGDAITLYQDGEPLYYNVINKVIVKEAGEPESVRRENARWIGPTDDERLTLVTCWPYHTNTHRLIVVAKPGPPPPELAQIDPLAVEGRTQPLDTAGSAAEGAVPAALFDSVPNGWTPPLEPLSRIVAPDINLDAPVTLARGQEPGADDSPIRTWTLPAAAAGWHADSALPGEGSNVVLSGYHNQGEAVFKTLVNLQQGDPVTLYAGSQAYAYQVVNKLILKDKGEPAVVRRANAQWIGPVDEERLTLVTGWPADDDTHNVIVIARPVP